MSDARSARRHRPPRGLRPAPPRTQPAEARPAAVRVAQDQPGQASESARQRPLRGEPCAAEDRRGRLRPLGVDQAAGSLPARPGIRTKHTPPRTAPDATLRWAQHTRGTRGAQGLRSGAGRRRRGGRLRRTGSSPASRSDTRSRTGTPALRGPEAHSSVSRRAERGIPLAPGRERMASTTMPGQRGRSARRWPQAQGRPLRRSAPPRASPRCRCCFRRR